MKKSITFKNRAIDVAADLYLPVDCNENEKYAAIVVIHPGSSCKEQTAGIYAEKLSRKGFVALAVNASYQGASGGEPRDIEDPAARMEDIRCAGGGYVINVSMTERRIKAVATSAGANVGRLYRGEDPIATIKMLEQIGKQRTAEAQGADPLIVPWVTEDQKEAEDIDLREAYEYYCTPRGQHPNSTNRLRFISMANVMAFDPYNMIETLLTQPLQIIIGDKKAAFASHNTGKEVYARAASKGKDLYVIEGASHYDLYDNPEVTDKAVAKLTEFYRKNLK